jgi:hypothetical protein
VILSDGPSGARRAPILIARPSQAALAIEYGRWHHVAGVISTSDGGYCALFLDGELLGERRNAGCFRGLRGGDGSPLLIARETHTFRGLIDEVRAYRRALSADEIARLARAGEREATGRRRGAAF